MNAVRVWRGKEAQERRQQFAGRILRSRMVRRKQPMPRGVASSTSHGGASWFLTTQTPKNLRTFAPTPQAEIINLFFPDNLELETQRGVWRRDLGFCQKLQRTAGRLFAEPCPGIDAEPLRPS